jgi:NitT/TauT family transport system ATP-binding protein
MDTSPAFALQDVGVSLSAAKGMLDILADVTFEVGAGEVVAIVGKSGTGKTTLLRVLGGLQPATHGTTSASGSDVVGPPPGVVTVFQDYTQALLPWRSVQRNVALGLERKLPRGQVAPRVEHALRMVHLWDRRHEYPWRLSGGMQQRVQIARALALEPRVLLMDEPFGALDAMTRATLQDEVLEVQARTGSTMVFITHDIDEAVYLSDRVLVIADTPGTIVADLEVALPRPRHQLTTREDAAFLKTRHELGVVLG